ncbi:ABC transporter ATP-binding protein [Saliterribacillus persicus]|uniref:Quaternary amine transport ATP-binding protein n=1 Tax=Saliterribacillus persicus TaxID=930114 RepID=A0A368Y342_9BACI|nr:ABC transporter ATP-binding protein [Saliterribacillus persicus]RCW74720.1 osmoprotectant transport system ATP-binding protein [Saliterribacillus persicus]
MIRFENVSKVYADETHAVDGVDLEIEKGEFFVIIGPSGCGKTTLLKMINRLIKLTDGTIFIDEKRISDYNIHELRWNIGYVLQQIALFPHMTIAENIAIVPEMKKWKQEETDARIDELLEMVGLDAKTYRDRLPHELSGGQQQRIGVVRALAADPDIILMDEPFSALDPISREKLQEDILDLQKKINKTIIFVTHDMSEALKLADRVCIMKEGNVVQLGTPKEIVQHPSNEFVRTFVGDKKQGLDQLLDVKSIMKSPENENEGLPSISVNSHPKSVLEALTENDRILIIDKGKTIGVIDRKTVFAHLAHQQDRGEVHA